MRVQQELDETKIVLVRMFFTCNRHNMLMYVRSIKRSSQYFNVARS